MNKMDFQKGWNAFVHWKGWKAFADGCVKGWNAAVHWSGWKKLFGLPVAAVLLLSVFCAAGLVWVFLNGLEQTVPAYILYGVSAYALIALCAKLPGVFRGSRDWMTRHPKTAAILGNKELKFKFRLYREQFINFGYGIFKIGSGIVYGSAWIGSDGIYNLTLSLIQLFQILRRKKPGTLTEQWRSYRFCGGLILVLHLTLTGIVFQMVNWNRVEEQGPITVIATAAFAFYKFASSFIKIAKDRKHEHPVDSAVRMLNLAQAIFAMFSLQAGLLHTFGTGEGWEHWLNLGTGCTVCLLIVSIGIYMVRRGNREIRTLQENGHG